MRKIRSAEKTVRDIRRETRRRYSAEEKIRSVLEGLRGENSITELCRREGLNSNVYYRWSKEFLEAGGRRLSGDTPMLRRSVASEPARIVRFAGLSSGDFRATDRRVQKKNPAQGRVPGPVMKGPA